MAVAGVVREDLSEEVTSERDLEAEKELGTRRSA